MIGKILELYARCGHSLLENGLNEAVLPISSSNYALDIFKENGWLVLGGDVYQRGSDGGMNNFYADWFSSSSDPIEATEYAKEHINGLKGNNLFISFTIKS